MKTTTLPEYQSPAHVTILELNSVLALIGAIIIIATSAMETDRVIFAAGMGIGAMYIYIFSLVAENAARAAWRTERTAHELQPILKEIQLQANERLQRREMAERAQKAEVQRILDAQAALKS